MTTHDQLRTIKAVCVAGVACIGAAFADDRVRVEPDGMAGRVSAGGQVVVTGTALFYAADVPGSGATGVNTWTTPLAGDAAGDIAGECGGFIDAGDGVEGDNPTALVFLADGSSIVVANRDSSTLTFVDPATGIITHTVPVGGGPVDVKRSADGQFLLTANADANSVSIVDVATRAALAEIPITGSNPYTVHIRTDGTLAYVGVLNDGCNGVGGLGGFIGCAADSDGVPSSVSVIDLGLRQEILSFPTEPQGNCGFGFAPIQGMFYSCLDDLDYSEPTNQLVFQYWLANQAGGGNDQIIRYDLSTGQELARIDAGSGVLTDLDISPDGLTAVAVTYDNILKKINLVSGAVTTYAIPEGARHVRITPNATQAVFDSEDLFTPGLKFLNLANGAVIGTVPVSIGWWGELAFSHDGQYLVTTGTQARIIRLSTRALLASITASEFQYELAVSPTELRAASLQSVSASDRVVRFTTSGATAQLSGEGLTGGAPEGDQTRAAALSAGGAAAGVNMYSNNVSAFENLTMPAATGHSPATDVQNGYLWDVALSPNGATAVATNMETYRLSVIDVPTRAIVAQFNLPAPPPDTYDIGLDRVLITADGTRAIVSEIGDSSDSIHFFNLNGSATTLTGSLQVGSMGYVVQPTLALTSAIRLSPDESLLAVCSTISDELVLVDPVARSIVARVPTGGDAPIDVVFAPDGARAYAANIGIGGTSIAVIQVDGANSSLQTTIPIATPVALALDTAGAYLYVATWEASANLRRLLHVIDTESQQIVASLELPILPGGPWQLPPELGIVGFPRAIAFDPLHSRVLVLSNEFLLESFGFVPPSRSGVLTVIDAAGPLSQVTANIPLAGAATDLEYHAASRRAILAQYGRAEGIEVICLGAAAPRADLNCDGSIDFFDIDPFLLALFDPAGYAAAFPACDILTGDIDGDGMVNFFDIDGFLSCLFAGGCP